MIGFIRWDGRCQPKHKYNYDFNGDAVPMPFMSKYYRRYEAELMFHRAAEPMTKAETIMRRAEAQSINHSQVHGVASGRLLSQLDRAWAARYGSPYPGKPCE